MRFINQAIEWENVNYILYPYFWTAAAAALALAFLIDRGHRNVYMWTACIGGVIGSLIFKSPEGKFHPAGFLLSLVGALVLLWAYLNFMK